MKWEPKLNEWVRHKKFEMKGKVVTVDPHWGWYEVEWEDGRFFRYHGSTRLIEPTVDPDIERADQRLREESLGITDSWREYDGEEMS